MRGEDRQQHLESFYVYYTFRITSRHPDDPRQPFYNASGFPMRPLARLVLERQRLYRKASCGSPGVDEYSDYGREDEDIEEAGMHEDEGEKSHRLIELPFLRDCAIAFRVFLAKVQSHHSSKREKTRLYQRIQESPEKPFISSPVENLPSRKWLSLGRLTLWARNLISPSLSSLTNNPSMANVSHAFKCKHFSALLFCQQKYVVL